MLSAGGCLRLYDLDDYASTVDPRGRYAFLKATPSHLAMLCTLPPHCSPTREAVVGGEPLFPGGQPGRPISAFQLGQRLRQLGLHPGQARSTALFQLATELPAAVLARTLGIHIAVAVAWQRASSGDWTNYAAEVSRRVPGKSDQ